jgi:calcium-dependent protein kinase
MMLNGEDNLHSFISKLSELGYTYVTQVGKGGFSRVHLVFSGKYNQQFVIKQNKSSSNFVFNNEFELMKQLLHPNIINLYSMIEIDSTDCIVLEYCSGGSIEDLIKSYGRIHPPKLYKYCFQILSAVNHMHQNNIARRDIKPSIILLDSHDRPKLTDFGLSQLIEVNNVLKLCGTTQFMAPEVLNRVPSYDPFLADIYSLGITFFLMSQGMIFIPDFIEGDVAFYVHENFIKKDIDPSFMEMLCKMLSKKPANRPCLLELMSHPIFQTTQKTTIGSSSSAPSMHQTHGKFWVQ